MEKADAYHNSIVFLFLWKTRYFYEDGLTNIITGINLNKAFVGLGSCDNVQTETSIFEYANWPSLQIKRTGPYSWSVQLIFPAGLSSWSIQLVCPTGLPCKVHLLQSAYVAKCTSCKVHMLQSACVPKCKK